MSDIAKGEIPCAKVYEDDSVLAFLDLSPVHPGHTLVIPKEHYKDMLHVPCELGTAVFSALKKVGAAVMGATGASGFNVMQNNGLSAGQTMFHIHWHIIPRFDGDGLGAWEAGEVSRRRSHAGHGRQGGFVPGKIIRLQEGVAGGTYE